MARGGSGQGPETKKQRFPAKIRQKEKEAEKKE